MRRTITAAAIGVAALAGCSSPDTREAPAPAASSAAGSSASPASAPGYADGTYSATGWYGGQPSSITVQLTLDNDVITKVRVTPHATDETSLDYQQRFADAVPAIVVGKDIDQVANLGRTAGSSGTPQGFNDALAQIKQQAAGN
jgi:uncharacterized protein with FMN-binding domain